MKVQDGLAYCISNHADVPTPPVVELRLRADCSGYYLAVPTIPLTDGSTWAQWTYKPGLGNVCDPLSSFDIDRLPRFEIFVGDYFVLDCEWTEHGWMELERLTFIYYAETVPLPASSWGQLKSLYD